MGIKRLGNFFEKHGIKPVVEDINQFRGKRIAIDLNWLMYKFKSMAIGKVLNTTKFEFKDGKWNEFNYDLVLAYMLENLIRLRSKLKRLDICLIFVLDGDAPEEKAETKNARKDKRKKNDKKQKDARTTDDLKNYKNSIKNNVIVTVEDRLKVFQTLKLMKCILIQAKGEAERLCAYMCNKEFVAAVYSRDTDLYAYGCSRVIYNIKVYNVLVPEITIMYMDDILRKLNLTPKQFLTFCIMCGTDFNNNLVNFGPEKCYALIKQYKDFETIKKHEPVYNDFNFESSWRLFTSVPNVGSIPSVPLTTKQEFITHTFPHEKIGIINALL